MVVEKDLQKFLFALMHLVMVVSLELYGFIDIISQKMLSKAGFMEILEIMLLLIFIINAGLMLEQ
jgi:hypothetical protein